MKTDHRTSFVLPADLHRLLVERAKREERSVSAQRRLAFREHLKRQEEER